MRRQELFTVGAERLVYLESMVEECLDTIDDLAEDLEEFTLASDESAAGADEGNSGDEEGDLRADLARAVVDLERARMEQHVRRCFLCVFSRSCSSLLVLTMHSSGKTLYSSAFDCATISLMVRVARTSLFTDKLRHKRRGNRPQSFVLTRPQHRKELDG